jgi:hypothetical protein
MLMPHGRAKCKLHINCNGDCDRHPPEPPNFFGADSYIGKRAPKIRGCERN